MHTSLCTFFGSLKYAAAQTHVPYTVNFAVGGLQSGTAPAVFGAMQTFDGGDPSHLRQSTAPTSASCSIFVEEETCSDAELAHTTETIGILAVIPNYVEPPPPPPVQATGGLVVEVGKVSGVALANTAITYTTPFQNPVILAGVPSHNGDEEAVVRIRGNIDTSGKTFNMYLDIPNHGYGEGAICGGNDHISEDFSWLIVEAGVYAAGVQAGATTGGICAGGRLCNPANGCPSCDHSTGFDWVVIDFNPAIETPVVISQIQSHTGGDWVKTRQKMVRNTGFQVKMEEDNLDIGHNTEIYGWMAIASGMGSIGSLKYEAMITPDSVTHVPFTVAWTQDFAEAPAFFAAMHTFDGGDPSHMRQSSVTATEAVMWVEEETCTDAELAHTTETVGVLVIEEGAGAGVSGGDDGGGPMPIEIGVASADLASVLVPINGAYDQPVVTVGIPSHNGDEELVVRITRIGDTSIDLYSDLPNHNNCGSLDHSPENFNWMIVNEGAMGDLQAGTTTGGLCAGGSLCVAPLCSSCDHQTGLDWFDVSFITPITNAVVVSTIQTHTGGDWCKTRQRSVTDTGFQARIEEDNLDGGHNTEITGWIAMPAGAGRLGWVNYEAIKTPDAVTHEPYDVSFATSFAGVPALFGTMQTYDGPDPSHMRYDALTSIGTTIFVEEETCTDSELAHTTEVIGLIVADVNYVPPAPPPPAPPGAGLMNLLEVGQVSGVQLGNVQVTYTGSFSSPVIIGGIPSHNGDEEAAVRIRGGIDTSAKTFNMYLDIPNHGYGEGAICGGNSHDAESFGWLMIEEGVYSTLEAGQGTYGQCSGGSLCNAANGCSSCDHSTGFDWLDVNFENPHPNPVVLSQIQSHTGGDWVKTRHQGVNPNSFQVKQEEDGLDIGHNTEVYGWLAMSKGTGNLGGLVYEAIVTPNTVTHNPYDVQFSTEFTRMPSIFGNIHTFNGADPSHLRMIAQEEYTFYDGHNAWSGQGALDDNEPVEGFRSCK